MPAESKRPYLHWFNGEEHVIRRDQYFRKSQTNHSVYSAIIQAAHRLGVKARISVFRDRVIVKAKPEPSWTEIAEKR
jgi:hypothetical protein